MTEVVLFHHALGLTPGVTAFADELRRAGHTVHTPDLYDGRRFETLPAGLAHAERIGFGRGESFGEIALLPDSSNGRRQRVRRDAAAPLRAGLGIPS